MPFRLLLSTLVMILAAMPLWAETAAPAAAPAAPAPAAEAPKVEAPKVETPKAETPAAAPAAEEQKADANGKQYDQKRVSKMRERWRKMTPEQRDEMRKKAERRLGERYDRLKSTEQDNIKNIMSEIDKLSKEQRSILMAKIRQKAYKDRQQRKMMKDIENVSKDATPKKDAADPNTSAH